MKKLKKMLLPVTITFLEYCSYFEEQYCLKSKSIYIILKDIFF